MVNKLLIGAQWMAASINHIHTASISSAKDPRGSFGSSSFSFNPPIMCQWTAAFCKNYLTYCYSNPKPFTLNSAINKLNISQSISIEFSFGKNPFLHPVWESVLYRSTLQTKITVYYSSTSRGSDIEKKGKPKGKTCHQHSTCKRKWSKTTTSWRKNPEWVLEQTGTRWGNILCANKIYQSL